MELLSSLIVEIRKCLWDPLKRHTGYLFYRRHIKKLQTQVEELEKTRDDVQQSVDVARRQGETVPNNVQQWLHGVHELKLNTESIVDRLADTKCWNPVLFHGLGKEAAEKIVVANDLLGVSNFAMVLRPRPPLRAKSLLPNSGFEALASTEVPMGRVLTALQDEKIQIIGVYGMGGVGKTMLIKEVAQRVEQKKLFDKVVMVTISQKIMIESIQQEIIGRLGLEFKEDSVLARAARLSEELKQVEKLLIILDDLWERLELSDIGIPYEHKGCKIIITTRNLHVCNTMKSQVKIQVTILSEDDSWTLFKATTGPVANSPELSNVAKNIVRECKGLPLAIVVLGRTLADQGDVRVWHAVFNRLKQSIPTDEGLKHQVFQSIKVSFDYLKSDEAKLCFLLCCLFPADDDIPDSQVARIMAGERTIANVETFEERQWQVHHLLMTLKDSGLILEGSSGNVRMHRIVRDVGIWIASDKSYGVYSKAGVGLKEWPISMKMEEHQRISLMDNDICVLPAEPFLPNLRTLLLNDNVNLSMIPESFFLGMEALKVLDLSNTGISYLPASISYLTNLKVLNLSGCLLLEDLSGIRRLKSLEILDLSKTNVTSTHKELQELRNPKLLVYY